MSIATDQRHLLSRLQHEWNHLAHSPSALSTARSWPLVIERFDSLDDLLRAAGYGRVQQGRHDDDEVLGGLVQLAREHDLAARVVLQRLLPGISSVSRRRARHSGCPLEAVDELLAAAWTVIRTFDVERHPAYVAATLLRTIEYHAFRREHRRKAQFIPMATDTFDHLPAPVDTPAPIDEWRDLMADAAAAGMAPADLELVDRLAHGESTQAVAATRQVTDRTIRNHRRAVVHRLREVTRATR
ncbi:MAG: hypothetical protein WCO88_11115 [Actinomycetota bacterium]|jgi:DNA-binding CsgD family transcriptional regulator